ncbi:MAG: hypothetical protein ACUVRZ_02810 [Desulfobacca sp.]|uniref:hypothetical protein n=1 Tax=Desulfobacca sp. TaxID=2067990 RepID=UPI00404BA317
MTTSDASKYPSGPLEQTDFAALAGHLDLSLAKPLGHRAWLAQKANGDLVVLKTGPGASLALHDFLLRMAALQPPFLYPRVFVARPDFYLAYDLIPGTPLSAADFEDEQVLAGAFDVSGRLTALFRSLQLAPMIQSLQQQSAAVGQTAGGAATQLAALEAGLGDRQDGLAVRRWEASQSYTWAQEILPCCAHHWPAADSRQTPPWTDLAQRVAAVTSIHLAVHGSSLAHTAFTPEHLLAGPADTWGVVGWRVAPRPYNYMRYRYLAWCLVHTPHGDIEHRYRGYLAKMPAIPTAAAHPLTFALTLLETWVESGGTSLRREEKVQVIRSFVSEALELPVADAMMQPPP